MDWTAYYKVSPYRWLRVFQALDHDLFTLLKPLQLLIMDFFWTDPPTFMKLPKDVDIASAVHGATKNWDDSCDQIDFNDARYPTSFSIGQIGFSLWWSAWEQGPYFIIVWISPYQLSTTDQTKIIGVVFPRFDVDPTNSSCITMSPFIRPRSKKNPKRIPKKNASWNDYSFDNFGYESKGPHVSPMTAEDYYPVHLLVPDLEPFQAFVDPVTNIRNEKQESKESKKIEELPLVGGDLHAPPVLLPQSVNKYKFDRGHFATNPIMIYKHNPQPIPSGHTFLSEQDNCGAPPGNVLTAQEFNGFIAHANL
jgi:hypothetical protein